MKLAAAASVLAVALALTGCSSQSGSSNPDRQSEQLPVPTSTN